MQTNLNSLNNLKNVNYIKHECQHCKRQISHPNHKRHEAKCKENAINQKECPICKTMHSKSGETCSYSCSNTLFRSGKNNPNYRGTSYTQICWEHHEKKCLVCGEDKIVATHHVNGNHNDNRPENLVPLCPTHHQYVHSRYKDMVAPIIDAYVKQYSERGSLADH